MEETRKFVFVKNGIYYKPNAAQTRLVAVNTNPDNWMTQEDLENLSEDILFLVADYELEIYSTIPEDEYIVHLEGYDVCCTTDLTNISTKGMRHIIKATPAGSDTCKMLFSFDKRQTWYTFNSDTREFVQADYNNIYAAGTPFSIVPTITTEEWNQIFARTAMDYAVAINSGETFESLTLTFPNNTAPDIEYITLSMDDIHDQNIFIDVKVVDFEDDDMNYKLYINNSSAAYVANNVNPLSKGKIRIEIKNEDLIVGTNTIRFVVYDAKGASNERTVTVVKSNEIPQAYGMVDNDLFSFTISDIDLDTVRYRIDLNDETIVPMTSFSESPLIKVIRLPRNKIIFGRKNTVSLYYEDKIKQTPLRVFSIDFTGYYYGILFFDPAIQEKTNPDGSISNEQFYSTSVGDILRSLDVGTIFDHGTTQSYEIGVINLSNQRFVTAKVAWKPDNENVSLQLSKQRAPFISEPIEFYDLEQGDSDTFFVRLKSLNDNAIGNYTTFIHADAYDK